MIEILSITYTLFDPHFHVAHNLNENEKKEAYYFHSIQAYMLYYIIISTSTDIYIFYITTIVTEWNLIHGKGMIVMNINNVAKS